MTYPVAPLHDSYSLLDAVPADNPNEYAVVRMTTHPSPPERPVLRLLSGLNVAEGSTPEIYCIRQLMTMSRGWPY